ncbi:unnamed protein product [Discosporangium mesarthrocarpum]
MGAEGGEGEGRGQGRGWGRSRSERGLGGDPNVMRTGPSRRFEILSLVGTLSPEGGHLHVSLGDEVGSVIGGHLVQAVVHTTAEVVVGEASALAFSRSMDERTGFKELTVREIDGGGS